MDVCYVLGSGSQYDNLEIKLSLRSIEQNGSNIGRVFVVGEKPGWIQNIEHIPFEDKYKKENNVFGKLITVAKSDISENFLYFNDDFYMMKPFNAETYPYFCTCEKIAYIPNPSRFQSISNRAIQKLKSMGVEKPKDFRGHCPMKLNKTNLLSLESMYEQVKNNNVGYEFRNIYGNLFIKEYEMGSDCKTFGDDLFENKQGCISSKDAGIDLLNKLLKIFDKPSKYEKLVDKMK